MSMTELPVDKAFTLIEPGQVVLLTSQGIREERRTFHAFGDGTFVVDGEILNYRSLMENKMLEGV